MTGTGTDLDWRTGLPDDVRMDPTVSRYNTAEAAARGLIEKQKALGGAVHLPAPDAPDAEWNEKLFGKLRPETPDAYDFTGTDDTLASWLRPVAHKIGLHPRQAKALIAELAAETAKNRESFAASLATERQALEQKWGAGKDTKLAARDRALAMLAAGGADVKARLEKYGIADDPVITSALAMIGEGIEEDREPSGARGTGGESRASIVTKIKAMLDDPKNPMNDRFADPELKRAAQDEYLRLSGMLAMLEDAKVKR